MINELFYLMKTNKYRHKCILIKTFIFCCFFFQVLLPDTLWSIYFNILVLIVFWYSIKPPPTCFTLTRNISWKIKLIFNIVSYKHKCQIMMYAFLDVLDIHDSIMLWRDRNGQNLRDNLGKYSLICCRKL